MRRKCLLPALLVVLLFPGLLFSRVVTQEEATAVAMKWIQYKNASGEQELNVEQYSIRDTLPLLQENETVAFLVILEPRGFMLVPALNELSPMKFISYTDKYDDLKDHALLKQILQEISATRKYLGYAQGSVGGQFNSLSVNGASINRDQLRRNQEGWDEISNIDAKDSLLDSANKLTQYVPNLLSSQWDQTDPYNWNCPVDPSSNKTSAAGCVAIAQAQIMNYWKYPNYGTGSNSYLWKGKTLYASFDHIYNWNQMKDSYSILDDFSTIFDIAQLVSDVGISVNMNYGSKGSSSSGYYSELSLTNFFKYATDIKITNWTGNLSAQEWFDTFKNQIDFGWPVSLGIKDILQGVSHDVVVDGYDTRVTNMVHLNMGWGGQSDNYYAIDMIAPLGYVFTGTPQTAITNIHPRFSVALNQPPGWSDKIVISNVTGTHSDSSTFGPNDTLYVDFSVKNLGESFVTPAFWVSLYVDGVRKNYWPVYAPFKAGDVLSWEDYSIGNLSPGSHSIKVIANPDRYFPEENELDNEYTKTILVQGGSTSLPNLRPFQPSGWSDKIVVSTVTGTHTDSIQIKPTDPLYVDYAILNDGNAATTATFYTQLYVDGAVKQSWRKDPPLSPAGWAYVEDYTLGSLSPGTHTIKIAIDYTNAIAESNEFDNEFTKTITVQGGITSLPNLTPYQPTGWSAPIVLSNVRGTHIDSSLHANETVYLDWAVINNGIASTSGTFSTSLYIDGIYKKGWQTTSSIGPNSLVFFEDYEIGSLTAGTHSIKIQTDSGANIPESNEYDNEYVKTISVLPGANATSTVFVPIVLSAAGLNGSFFTSELVLTNRGNQDGNLIFVYEAAFGSGSGTGTGFLPAGHQEVHSDAIAYLRSIGLPIPISGNQGGTLKVQFNGLSSSSDGAVTVRTTTAVADGRAGLAYPGIPVNMALNETVYLCGLRQNQTDRSNVAVQNVGTSEQGNTVLQLTVYSGDPLRPGNQRLPEVTLSPGGFFQIAGILQSNGLNFANGYVKVERVSGSAPYYAYGVINDQANSDGSFIFPIREAAHSGKTLLTLPVLVEASSFSSELVVTNWSNLKKSLNCQIVADAFSTGGGAVGFKIDINPGEQLIIPEVVDYLRKAGIAGIGLKGGAYAGAMSASIETGDMSGISISARTSSPGGGGRFGLFYSCTPYGMAISDSAWVYGLQQNAENRSNLAIVNTGEIDNSADTFRLELFDGNTGVKVNTIDGFTLNAKGWKQIGAILGLYAPGTSQGYIKVTKVAGNNSFLTYGVVNDGGQPGERTGDGAFISSSP